MGLLLERLTSLRALVGAGVACIVATFGIMTYLSTTYANRADTDKKIEAITKSIVTHSQHDDVAELRSDITLIKLRAQRRGLVEDLRLLDRTGQCEGRNAAVCERMRDDIKNIDDEVIHLYRTLPRPKTRGLPRR